MLKKNITYTDFNGDEVTETFYFNLSEPELVEMEVEYKEGFAKFIEEVINAKDNKTLVKLMKDLILKTYGQKSPDGKRFIKSETLCEEFSQTGAYIALFMELATNDSAATVFIKGVLPKNLAANIDQNITEVTPIKPS